jgi:MT0933-like antitoxin protein
MGMSDMVNKAKDALRGHSDKADQGVDKGMDMAADKADDMTGGKHSDQIDKGRDMAADRTKDAMDKFSDDS